MKKVLVFGMSDNLGGVETVILNYYRNLDKENIKFDFLYNTESIVYEDEIKKSGGKLYKITPRRRNILKYHNELKAFFKEHAKEYDAIWVNLCILSNIDWLKYAKKYGIKCRILHSHNSQNMENSFKLLLHKFNRLFVKKYATHYWACSDKAAEWFYSKDIIDSKKYQIIHNAINTKKYEYNADIRKKVRMKLGLTDKFVVGHVGRFHFQKNHKFLIDIFEEICKLDDNSILLLIGKGEDEEEIKQLVDSKHLSNKVIFMGSRNDVNDLMQSMDVFVFPSLFEGLPLVLIEAQANGLKIYSSKECIPKNIKITDNFEFMSLSDSETLWARKIVSGSHEHLNNLERIIIAGYDINEECKKINNFFIEL